MDDGKERKGNERRRRQGLKFTRGFIIVELTFEFELEFELSVTRRGVTGQVT